VLRPTALDHVGVLVTDMDRALAFYRTLGLEVLRVSTPKPDGGRSAVLALGAQEINLFSNARNLPADRERPGGIHHFCLTMDSASIGELVDALGRAGLRITGGPTERRDGTSVFVDDPDGNRVELRIPGP
jgi:catechol 2,3-dioxygenase-like lactoylglutathione lyase family enzyme